MALELVLRAAAFAAEAHVEQTRKQSTEPYINHPLRVAQAASEAALSPEAIAAALLHDVVEDTGVTLEDLRGRFPERVVHLVDLLTKWWPDDAPLAVKREGKPRYYGAIRRDMEACAIKLLDRADNLADMARMLPQARGWAERYLKKTREELAPIHERSDNAYARARYAEAVAALEAALARTRR